MDAADRLADLRIAIIGGGVMGKAFCQALIGGALSAPERIFVVEPDAAKRASLTAEMGVRSSPVAGEDVVGAGLLLLAVKPQVFPTAAAQLKGHLRPESLVLSIMAGLPVATIARGLGHQAVVRAMPNAAAGLRQSMTVWYASPAVDGGLRDVAARALSAIGLTTEVKEESLLDAATAVSGSGPAYVCMLVEAMIEGAVACGFAREVARCLAVQTLAGTAALLSQPGAHPALVRESVTSPAGTTAAGLLALEARGMRAAVVEAILASQRRAKELGSTNR